MNMQLAARVFNQVLHWVRLLAELVWMMIATSVSSLWTGVPTARERIIEDWKQRASRAGMPTEWLPQFGSIVAIVSVIVMIVFWVVCAEITVLVLRLIF